MLNINEINKSYNRPQLSQIAILSHQYLNFLERIQLYNEKEVDYSKYQSVWIVNGFL